MNPYILYHSVSMCAPSFPIIENGVFFNFTSEPFYIATTITLLCMDGFLLENDEYKTSFMCSQKGVWEINEAIKPLCLRKY